MRVKAVEGSSSTGRSPRVDLQDSSESWEWTFLGLRVKMGVLRLR